jgi:hypothetical protein
MRWRITRGTKKTPISFASVQRDGWEVEEADGGVGNLAPESRDCGRLSRATFPEASAERARLAVDTG